MVWDTSHQQDEITSFRFGNFSEGWRNIPPNTTVYIKKYKHTSIYIYIYTLASGVNPMQKNVLLSKFDHFPKFRGKKNV